MDMSSAASQAIFKISDKTERCLAFVYFTLLIDYLFSKLHLGYICLFMVVLCKISKKIGSWISRYICCIALGPKLG